MTKIAALIEAMLYKDKVKEDEKSLLDKNPKFKNCLNEYKQKREELQREMKK